ncbi:aldo/keto reductase [Alkaliphilus peptidifermentans]|uniref:Predicted oxidoreductase of the aldo/keto reductase family n=1 Tax=Alkaliphilus peptidifermentans DSM 18978 TaxID=1120976 RepID=A0A1G5KZ64_9FIRM|nr:aldo/keto reductase [Alkaliphilus peptidifermentans]SCZ05398.1 Predicted oxidoreductase of the aldo/keto reductase family [Alkaliphilus peptidifermentans DSM 18978]
MELRKLGRTNYRVGVIGFGGIPLQRLKDEEAIGIVQLAAEEDINFIDTARGYGRSEELIGKSIQGIRDKFIIATKSTSRDYESMKKDIEISLNNLKCEWIDLYQLHLVKTQEQYQQIMSKDGAYGALKEAQEKGIIKEIGITSHSKEMLEFAIETDNFSTIQFPYNVVEQQGKQLFKRAYEKNIGVIVMKPLAGGALHKGDLALRFILENPHVSVVIPGVDKKEQIIENSSVGKSFKPLNQEERKILKEIKEELGLTFCRRCGYCQPCPQGIDISTQFLIEGYYSRYELQDWALERYSGLPKIASDCIKCGACEPRCPYDLPIRKMMENVAKKLEGKN